MNESESLFLSIENKSVVRQKHLIRRRCEQARREPVHWLCAYRYIGDMTLMQALRGNTGDPTGENLMMMVDPGSIRLERGGIRQRERHRSIKLAGSRTKP
jgi:hypothetical protein